MPVLEYADFDYYLSSAEIEAILDLSSPMVGVSSLLIRRVSGALSPSCTFAPKVAFAQGVTRGRLRALVDFTLNSTSQSFGLLCMQSQRDLTIAGQAYALRWQPNDNILELLLLTSGLDGGESSLASGVLAPAVGINVLQLEWVLDLAVLGGIALMAYHGTATNFSGLTQVLTHSDLSTTLGSTVTEGGFYQDGGAGFDFDVRFDQMRLEGP